MSKEQIIASSVTIFMSETSDSIDVQDLKLTLATVGDKLTDEEIDEILQHADYDKNGNISLKDFKDMLKY